MVKKIFKTGLIFLLAQCLLFACQEPVGKVLEPKQVNSYFLYEYLNHAWGYSHGGIIINPAGEIYSFDKTTPWIFATNNLLSLKEINSNISASIKKDTLIHSADIAKYQQLAYVAMNGKMIEPTMRGADMGAILCKILVPETGSANTFREIILSQNGDIEFHNLTPEAAQISDWLKSFHLP